MGATVLIVVALAGLAGLLPGLARRRLRRDVAGTGYVPDPERDLAAERRAAELLRSTAGPEAHAMYEQLGFLAVAGRDDPAYGYLIYPHRPIVSYDARTGALLSEHCVRFPDREEAVHGSRLPDADDVLAKWMSLHGDEEGLLRDANMHLPGRQLDPGLVRRDLRRVRELDAARARARAGRTVATTTIVGATR
jgi:hypothetical protein